MSDQQTEQDEQLEPITGELVPVEHHAQVVRTVDMRSTATDSWTDVIEDVADLAVKIAPTDFVPADYRGKPGQVAASILHGRELGLPPMTALALTNPIKGKPTISAEGMRSLVLQAGHSIAVAESSGSRVILRGRRRGEEEWTTVEWTLEDARRAGLVNGTNWQKYPRQMLTARATAELCRLVFPDVIHGMRAAEELMDEVDTAAVQAVPEVPARTTTVQRGRTRKASEPKAQPASEPVEKPDTPTPEPPARKRAELPTKRTSPTPAGESADTGSGDPEPSVEQQQEQIRRLSQERRDLQQPDRAGGHDRERSEEQPEDSPAPRVAAGPGTGPKASNGQKAALMQHWGRLGMMNDRDERLLVTATLLGLEPGSVESTSKLTAGQATKLIQIIERLRDRDALDAHLNGQADLLGGDQS